jgi:hypothetical protein
MLDDDAMAGQFSSEVLPAFCYFSRSNDRRPGYFVPRQSTADLTPHPSPLAAERAGSGAA